MKRKFVEKLIILLGGFVTVDQAIDSIESEEEKHKILTRAVAKLYNMVTEEDVFKKDGVRYTYKGKPLIEAQVVSMKNQAKGFLESELFKMLNLELKHQANLKMYTLSRNEMDVISGKLMLYSWDVIKSKLHNL